MTPYVWLLLMSVHVTCLFSHNLSCILHTIYSNGYGKQVPVHFEIASHVCDAVITDEEWMWQMLLNLLTNACKYTDRGSIRVVVSYTRELVGTTTIRNSDTEKYSRIPYLTLDRVPEMLLFEVIDTGLTLFSF